MLNAEFDRCVDFLARMIEKYGNEVDLSNEKRNDTLLHDSRIVNSDKRRGSTLDEQEEPVIR